MEVIMGIIRIEKMDKSGIGSTTVASFDSVAEADDYMCNRIQKEDKAGLDNGDYTIDGPDDMLNEFRKPLFGMPATICHYTDRDPATISFVSSSGKRVKVRVDNWEVISGGEHDGSAQYKYTENKDGAEWEFTLRSNGRWVKTGESAKQGTFLKIGHRRRYCDPHF
jgi:hypothetical protein